MKTARDLSRIVLGGECGRGCCRSGEFETVKEPDPDRAGGPISESCLSARKGDSSERCVFNFDARSATSPPRKADMSYKIAAIDIHKRVLMVVVATTAAEVADATGAAVEFEWRKFGAGADQRNQVVSWLQQHRCRKW